MDSEMKCNNNAKRKQIKSKRVIDLKTKNNVLDISNSLYGDVTQFCK